MTFSLWFFGLLALLFGLASCYLFRTTGHTDGDLGGWVAGVMSLVIAIIWGLVWLILLIVKVRHG